MNYVSLCSGIGGLDLGLDGAGTTGILQCENDPDALKVLARHWPDVPKHHDLTTLTAKDIHGHVDLICGGTPCQDLSVAGDRAGLAGEQSRLFFEFMRVVDQVAPRWVLWENVPGLLSSNKGRDMGIVLGTLADLGYGFAYRVLDSQYFGVAQRRRRVFLVGCAGDPASAAQVLFEPESCDRDLTPRRQTGTGVAALTSNGVGTGGADDNQAQAGHLIPALTGRCGNTLDDQQTAQLIPSVAPTLGAGTNRTEGTRPPGTTVDTCESLIPFHPTQDPISGDETTPAMGAGNQVTPLRAAGAVGANGAGIGREGDPSLTLDTTGDMAIAANMQVRRLTPQECERLQGFPDGWTDQLADSARYRTLGNAVTVNVAEWIGRRIMEASK